MAQRNNHRQLEVEKYFLSKSPRSTTFTVKTLKEDSSKRRGAYQPSQRVHWSPTRRHRDDLPSRGQTDFPALHTTHRNAEEFTPRSVKTSEFRFEEEDRQASIAKLPQLVPSLKVHRLSDGTPVLYNNNPEKEYDEQVWHELNPNKIPALITIKEITEEEVDGVIRKHDIPVKYQHYRSRRESIEKAAKENWILTQENKEMQKRHAKQWKSLQILFDKQSNCLSKNYLRVRAVLLQM